MSREIEVTLELSKAAMDTLLRSDLLAGPSEDVSQRDIYFDTPDQKLRNAGFSLRIRQAGGVRTQTIKATAPGTAGLFARPEWERIVDDDHPVLDHEAPIATAPWPVFSADELAPLFIVEVQRKRWLHRENGSEIEIALDEGLVVAGDRQSPVLELELELKDGRTSDLFLAARRLEASEGGRIGVLSKSEKGYRLIASSRNAFKAEPVQLDRFQSAVDAFQLIAQSCFRQFRLNETVLLDRRNTEALHQARVSIRRLRSAFSAFKPIIDDPEAVRINSEFRWLACVLGEARNINVLIAKAETGELQSRLNDLRMEKYDDVIDALKSQRALALAMDFVEWVWCGKYLDVAATADARHAPVREFAGTALDRLRKRIRRHAEALSGGTDSERHEVRKDAKKLRYAAEFFASLYDGKRGRRRYRVFGKAMEELQDRLGGLNDLATGPDILRDHGLAGHPDARLLTATANKDKLLRASGDALADLIDAKKFWK